MTTTGKRRRSARKSPIPVASPPPSPTLALASAAPAKKRSARKDATRSPEPARNRSAAKERSPLHLNSPPSGTKALASVSDLRELVSSRLRDLRSNLIDRSHSEIVNDLDASRSRLHKRLKIQTQASQQVMDESEKEYKKTSERIVGSCEAMRDSYEEFTADVQATLSRVCKTTIPDLSKSFEKLISGLQARFGISSA